MFVRLTVCLLGLAALSSGAVVISAIGDQDALGTATAPGGSLPAGPFDNRSPAEAAAVDGSQNTDLATVASGIGVDNTFLHSFLLPPGVAIARAVLELGIGGVETNDSNPATSNIFEDALFIDGVLIPEAFAGVDQGPAGYDILRFELPAAVFGLLSDGAAAVSIDLNSNAGLGLSSRIEPVFYDFSRLTIATVPEPSTTLLFLGGAAAAVALRRRAR